MIFIIGDDTNKFQDTRNKIQTITQDKPKEIIHWLELLIEANPQFKLSINKLIQEAIELRNILSSIISKVDKK